MCCERPVRKAVGVGAVLEQFYYYEQCVCTTKSAALRGQKTTCLRPDICPQLMSVMLFQQKRLILTDFQQRGPPRQDQASRPHFFPTLRPFPLLLQQIEKAVAELTEIKAKKLFGAELNSTPRKRTTSVN